MQIASLGGVSGAAANARFAAAATFYPGCAGLPGARLQIPTLILIGAVDTVTPAAACEQLARSQPGGEAKLIVYPGAGHVFDDPAFRGGRQLMSMWLEFDQKAAAESKVALRNFLAAEIGR